MKYSYGILNKPKMCPASKSFTITYYTRDKPAVFIWDDPASYLFDELCETRYIDALCILTDAPCNLEDMEVAVVGLRL